MSNIRPQAMIYTLYDDYIRHASGSIWIGSLIRLLGHFGISQQAVRSTVSRMTQRGLLQVERIGARSFYSLTPKSTKIVAEDAARVFPAYSARERWDGRWHLVTYSIPESARDARDHLRRQLEWMGFGMLSNALWISPHDYGRPIEQLANSLGVRAQVELFTARHDGWADPKTLVARCWDLAAINARYAAFVEEYRTPYEQHVCLLERGDDLEPSLHFVHRFNLTDAYRRCSSRDPELPAELVPGEWRGREAADLFRNYHALLANKANAFFDSVFECPAGTSVATQKSRLPQLT